jgi:hypothetical protein
MFTHTLTLYVVWCANVIMCVLYSIVFVLEELLLGHWCAIL